MNFGSTKSKLDHIIDYYNGRIDQAIERVIDKHTDAVDTEMAGQRAVLGAQLAAGLHSGRELKALQERALRGSGSALGLAATSLGQFNRQHTMQNQQLADESMAVAVLGSSVF